MSTITNPQATAATFRTAAKIMQDRGHCKGTFEQPTGEVCAVGAIHSTGSDPRTRDEAIDYLSDRLHVAISDDDPVERIAEWNDAPERTDAEVLKGLLDAACALETDYAPTTTGGGEAA